MRSSCHFSPRGILVFLLWSWVFPRMGLTQSPSPQPFSDLESWKNAPWWEAITTGNLLWEKGEKEGAIRKWEEAVGKGFQDGLVFYHLGMHYRDGEDWDKAVKYLGLAQPWLERDKKNSYLLVQVYASLGGAYLKLGKFGEAYIHYRKAFNLEPESPVVNLGLGTLYLRQGKLPEAVQAAQAVLKSRPDNPRAFWILARAAERGGDYDSAVQYYRKVLELDPGWWETRLALSMIFSDRLGKLPEAEGELKKVVAAAPSAAPAHAALGEIYFSQGKLDLAGAEVGRALSLQPGNIRALVTQGQMRLEQGDEAGAESSFLTASRLNPGSALAQNGLALVSSRRGDWKTAESLLREVVRKIPSYTPATYNLAIVLERQGKRKEAVEQLRETTKNDPAFTPAQVALGKLYYFQGEKRKAIAFFQNALALDRRAWEPHYFLGKCHLDLGENLAALDYFERAVAISASNPAIHCDLAAAYERAGKADLAEQSLRRALEVDPQYLRAILSLALFESRRKHFGEASLLTRRAAIIRPGDVRWGYGGEGRDFLEKMVSSLQDYLSAGIDYLSLIGIIREINRQEGGLPEMVPLLQAKIKEHPLTPHYWHMLGLAYSEMGRPAQSEECYLRALKLDSDFAAAHLSVGQLYLQQGKPEQACSHLQAFLDLAPDSSFASGIEKMLSGLRGAKTTPAVSGDK